MSKEKFEDWRPSESSLETVRTANRIMADYQAQGYRLSLRQLYYRFVSLDLFPEDRRWRRIKSSGKWVKDPKGTKNADPNYKWLGGLLNRGRLAGLVDWEILEDRGREVVSNVHWEGPGERLKYAARVFQIDKWIDQPHRVFVLCEKDALSGVLEPVCRELDVYFTACKGYTSLSHAYEIASMIREEQYSHDPVILYFGDHDPSGLDMDRDLQERIELLSGVSFMDFDRLALTMDQIEEYDPPADPAKLSDSRAAGYIEKFGETSWEIDSLDPAVLAELTRESIIKWRDDQLWEAQLEKQAHYRARMAEFAEEFEE